MENGGVDDARARRAARQEALTADLLAGSPYHAKDAGFASGRDAANKGDGPDMMTHAVKRGVTVSWLCQIFDMEPVTVRARLVNCEPIHRRKNGFIYDAKTAIPYLVKPIFDVEEYLKTMKVEELPTRLQDQYWSAMNKRQKWEENAKNLWRTEDVAKAFGEVFLMIRNQMQLWLDQLELQTHVTEEQAVVLASLITALQKDMFEKIKKLPLKPDRTPPQLAELEEEEPGKRKRGRPRKVEAADDDDDFSVI